MEKIVVVGASGHGRVVIDTLERESRYEIAGLLDRGREAGERVFNHDVLGREEDLPRLMEQRAVIGAVIAIGDNVVRSRVAEKLRSLSRTIRFVTVVHPTAVIAKDVRHRRGHRDHAGSCRQCQLDGRPFLHPQYQRVA